MRGYIRKVVEALPMNRYQGEAARWTMAARENFTKVEQRSGGCPNCAEDSSARQVPVFSSTGDRSAQFSDKEDARLLPFGSHQYGFEKTLVAMSFLHHQNIHILKKALVWRKNGLLSAIATLLNLQVIRTQRALVLIPIGRPDSNKRY